MPIVTDVNTLLLASACYSGQTLSLSQQKGVDIYLLAAQLNARGGTNYIGNLERLLLPDAVCYTTLQPDEFHQVNLQIDYNNAVAAGATIGDISAQLAKAACIRNATIEQMDGMILYLKASLYLYSASPLAVTDVNVLLLASGCYSGQTLGLANQKAVDIYLLAAQLAAAGGKDYTGDLSEILIDAACYFTLEPDQFQQINLQIDNNNATGAGASIGDISAQLAQAACILNATIAQMDGMLLFLKAKLGKASPQ